MQGEYRQDRRVEISLGGQVAMEVQPACDSGHGGHVALQHHRPCFHWAGCGARCHSRACHNIPRDEPCLGTGHANRRGKFVEGVDSARAGEQGYGLQDTWQQHNNDRGARAVLHNGVCGVYGRYSCAVRGK